MPSKNEFIATDFSLVSIDKNVIKLLMIKKLYFVNYYYYFFFS